MEEDGSIVRIRAPTKVDVTGAKVETAAHPCESPVAMDGRVLALAAIYQMEPSGWMCCYLTWLSAPHRPVAVHRPTARHDLLVFCIRQPGSDENTLYFRFL